MALPSLHQSSMQLFGGEKPWSPLDWTDSDDRVRGGSSQSYFIITPGCPTATFRGNLDTQTLGGAGFASQRTTGENRTWDISAYDGLEIAIVKADRKRYTITIKDELLPLRDDGREQSTVSWEYDFVVNTTNTETSQQKVFIPWTELKATYRGRDQPDAKPLDLKRVMRFSLMMRSFFAQQEGDFEMVVRSIHAVKRNSNASHDIPTRSSMESLKDLAPERNTKNGWMSWVWGVCGFR